MCRETKVFKLSLNKLLSCKIQECGAYRMHFQEEIRDIEYGDDNNTFQVAPHDFLTRDAVLSCNIHYTFLSPNKLLTLVYLRKKSR